jgi:hypothetical protein
MMSLSNCNHTLTDRTISGAHASIWLAHVAYLEIKFSNKIITTVAHKYGRVYSGAADFF